MNYKYGKGEVNSRQSEATETVTKAEEKQCRRRAWRRKWNVNPTTKNLGSLDPNIPDSKTRGHTLNEVMELIDLFLFYLPRV